MGPRGTSNSINGGHSASQSPTHAIVCAAHAQQFRHFTCESSSAFVQFQYSATPLLFHPVTRCNYKRECLVCRARRKSPDRWTASRILENNHQLSLLRALPHNSIDAFFYSVCCAIREKKSKEFSVYPAAVDTIFSTSNI